MAFMFETRFPQMLTRFAAELETRQDNYIDCWEGLKSISTAPAKAIGVERSPWYEPGVSRSVAAAEI